MATVNTETLVRSKALVAALDQHELRLVMLAARAYAEVLDVADTAYPSPDMRADADILRALADVMSQANAARPFLA